MPYAPIGENTNLTCGFTIIEKSGNNITFQWYELIPIQKQACIQ